VSDIFDAALLREPIPLHPLEQHMTAIKRREIESRRAADEIERLRTSNADLISACRKAIVAIKGREHTGFLTEAIARASILTNQFNEVNA